MLAQMVSPSVLTAQMQLSLPLQVVAPLLAQRFAPVGHVPWPAKQAPLTQSWPVGQAHVPSQPSLSPAHLPVQFRVQPQTPSVPGLPPPHVAGETQVTHARPFLPHAVSLAPSLHVLPSQQPAQPRQLIVPPQPSCAVPQACPFEQAVAGVQPQTPFAPLPPHVAPMAVHATHG